MVRILATSLTIAAALVFADVATPVPANARVRDCRGRTFTYVAWRRGRLYHVSVRARDGLIVDYFRVGGGTGSRPRGHVRPVPPIGQL